MIRSFTVTNYRDESLQIELSNPSKEGFAVVGIDGIGPLKANVNITDIASIDGGLFNSARIGSRNIVISLVYYYDSDYDIEDLRHKSYRYFPPKKQCKLCFRTDKREVYIEGVIESNEVAIFNKQEGSQISIMCAQPFFYTLDKELNQYNDFAVPSFTFPFYHEVDDDSEKLLMGTILSYKLTEVTYNGDVDTGLIFSIDFKSVINNNSTIQITNGDTFIQNTISIAKLISLMSGFITGFNAISIGDSIRFSTVKGNKYVNFVHDNKEYNVLGCVTSNGDWLYLIPGINRIRIDTSDTDADVDISSENRIYFNGV